MTDQSRIEAARELSFEHALGDDGDVFTEILRRLERALRNGSRAHLENHHARALLTSKAFFVLSELKQDEMKKRWQEEAILSASAFSSANIGCGTGPTGTTGASAGSTVGPLAERVSASAAAIGIIRRTKRKPR
jgi:hypothetical protein